MTAGAKATLTRRRKRPRLHLRLIKGALVPADHVSVEMIRRRGWRVGDVLAADLSKPRNPQFNRLVHALGLMCADQIDDFAGLDGHAVIKRIQIEGDIGCETVMVRAGGLWAQVTDHVVRVLGESARPALVLIANLMGQTDIPVRVPRSLAFSEMEEGEFHELYRRMADYIARTYWPDLDAPTIQDMAELMPAAA
ncbi:hypothetical protein JN531_003815 [Flagellatimonas centrodinii]|uniref:hypothetical protein n=1 Tax=Flagellatimonas centrodinii TaxID=2806210 RepID=UPI001FF80540|nr:hypothetical protein [Flagellatimonas centrodinii]ULQ47414.1 hypothetical protein JN531_003815 [Flagellatimonas centrodinii]